SVGDVAVLAPGEESLVDEHQVRALYDAGKAQLGGGSGKGVVDLSAVRYISSAGFNFALLGVKAKTRGAGGVVGAGLLPELRELAEMRRLPGLVPCFPTAEEALAYFAGRVPAPPAQEGASQLCSKQAEPGVVAT